MTTYPLTAQDDDHNGGNGNDVFEGPAGGADTLRGNGGADIFKIQSGQSGSITGGTGIDRIVMESNLNNEFASTLQITDVEELLLDATNIYATAAQLGGFDKIDLNNTSDQFSVFLQGAGGSLDFRTSYTEPQKLSIEAEMATSAVRIKGSMGNNEIIGSDFNDNINGFKGSDRIYGGSGDDTLNGGLGKDYLYGNDGNDSYVFNSKLAPNNVDHLGEFRGQDDTIKLESNVFKWAGQQNGQLKADAFKVIGDGQTLDANDHVIYNENSGKLYYDVDGRGGAAMKLFAIADNFAGDVPEITHHDFVLV